MTDFLYRSKCGSGVDRACCTSPDVVQEMEINSMPPAAKNGDGVGPNGLKMLQTWLANGYPP